MSTSAYTRIPVIILAALALAACPGKKHKHHDDDDERAGPSIFYVNTSAGSDTNNNGTQSSPFKTITKAMTVATRSGSTVHVAPGTYTSGEAFPITVPAGVLLIGDETNQGGGSTPTSIVGGGLAPGATAGSVGVALLPGTGSTIAGFTITNNASFTERRGLILRNSTVTLRNNTVTGATHKVGVYVDVSTNHMITGNRIVDNGGSGTGSGLAFVTGGAGSKVENNIITGNAFGVEYDVAGGDLGSGSAGSAGGNLISCNTQNDLLVRLAAPSITISAANNFWDHSPPTLACTSAGDDICDVNAGTANAATIVATPARLASSPCPTASVFFVNVSSVGPDAGSDANPGTQALPFKTITHAMTKATSGSTVQVLPGIYDTSDLNTPEVFPITVPAGVLLIGDEANKGGGSSPTTIFGGGSAPAFPGVIVALLPGTGSTIAGFTITNASGNFHDGLILSNSSVTLRNNTITGESRNGVNIDASTNHVITGNQIVNNPGSGLAFINGGVGSKVEMNVITHNGAGVEYDVAGGDLGGGSAGSAGRNVISCNGNDLVAAAQTPITISAANNFWDHATPNPTVGCSPGNDICDFSTVIGAPYVLATINTPNAAQTTTPPACP